ncbi:MAG: tRNA pseudouridine(55) synthase TruB [Gammaproteobacteria bacterium]|nr:tRNA pseudouridine(55) synthase TruB [Gammaproteobacteria bacterium]
MKVRRDGLLVLDKPPGLTSTQALSQAKRQLRALKGGHTGTLDPLATGVLVLCFGEATKVAPFLLDADKRYRVVIGLGVSTTTYDAQGEITLQQPVQTDREQVARWLSDFVGDIEQVPPRFSAIKKEGVRFYERARKGDLQTPPSRRVRIDRIDIVALEGADLTLDVTCGKGVYVRSLAHDLGARLGCGGHVKALQRLAVAGFTIDEAVALADVTEQTPLVPGDHALRHLPAVELPPLLAVAVCKGQAVHIEGAASGPVRLYDANRRFVGVGTVGADGSIRPTRLWCAGGSG